MVPAERRGARGQDRVTDSAAENIPPFGRFKVSFRIEVKVEGNPEPVEG